MDQLLTPTIIDIVIFLALTIILFILSRQVLNRFYPTLSENNTWYLTKKVVNTLIYVIIFTLFIVLFSDRFEGVYTTIGLAGAGITFALREVIVSFAGWFAILFGDFFKVGDRVLLGGIKGDVIDLGILRTTLMEIGEWVEGDQYNGRIVRVANSFIFTSPVYNYSANFSFVWDEIHIPLRFGSDVALVKQYMLETAQQVIGSYPDQAAESWRILQRDFKLEDAALNPQTFMTFDDNWIDVSLRYIVDMQQRRITKDRLYTALLEKFEAHNDRIELASQTFEIVRMPNESTFGDHQV